MDGREGMIGSAASYYFSRGGIGISGSGPGPGPGPGHGPAGAPPGPHSYKHLQNASITMQSAHVGGGSGNLNSTFHIENPSHSFAHGVNVTGASPVAPSDPGKKKRGRPRKYAPDGANMSLGLSTMSSKPSSGPVSATGPKKPRGRPRGTGWKQQLASLGEWMNTSAGLAFTPHVIHVGLGEDVCAKVLSFAQQKPRALCILSGTGSVSAVTLRQSVASGGNVTYEGRFEILCLSGSYLLAETGGTRNRTGGLSISVCSPDGHVLGGAVGGRLIAAGPVQVVVCSFVWGGKAKNTDSGSKDETNFTELAEKSYAVLTQDQIPNSVTSSYPLGSQLDSRSFQTEIDLTRG